jgi:acyl-coenzyme A synthetase/AMP-(fatty) acid ligase
MPVPAGVIRRAEAGFGATLHVSYGQTEACGLTHTVRPGDWPEARSCGDLGLRRPRGGSPARPVTGRQAEIADQGSFCLGASEPESWSDRLRHLGGRVTDRL